MASVEANRRVKVLMDEFREYLNDIDQQREDLKAKVEALVKLKRAQRLSSVATTSGTTSGINNGTSTSDSYNSTTSTTDKTESTKPPSYRTAVPQPPARTRRKSILQFHPNTSTSDSQQSSTISTTRKSSGNMNTLGRGALIVLEGVDRVGKSTLAEKLVTHIKNFKLPVIKFRFPDRTTPIGQLIDKELKRHSSEPMTRELHLLFAANRFEHNLKIRETLEQGVSIIVDRYSYSGIAYSCAQKGIDMSWCCTIESDMPKPDLVIYLELPEITGLASRSGFGGERFETLEFLKAVRKQYEKIMTITKEKWIRVDVENKGPDVVLAEVSASVRECLETCANKPIGNLSFSSI